MTRSFGSVARENEKRGAKTKLTPELQKKMCDMIAAVATVQEAAYACGIVPQTVYQWIDKGERDPSSVYAEFVEAIASAKSQRTMGLKAQIRAHGKKDWRALQAIGAITDPGTFVPKIRVHITNELNTAVERLMQEFADAPETLERALHAIAGGNRRDEAGGPEDAEGGEDAEGSEAVRAAPAELKTESVP